jgi:hypothetical protein
LWFHLATGRLVARGEFSFGVDPFAYTTAQAYWACHAWLFDLGLYELYGLIGGPGLVILKALLVVGLAVVLLCFRRPASGPWLPVVCTTLAILAMSPRLILQPACVSYFLLALTFWILWKPHAPNETETMKDGSNRSFFILPLVFALWVNIDEWFFLGLVLVALFWLGERWQGQRRTPGWVVPAGLAACFLNPYTFHAFTLPPELSAVPWTSGLRQDVRFQAFFASPWWSSAYLHAAWPNPAALAYYALTALSVVSFLLCPTALRGWRVLVWLPFTALAAWQARTIPFFAVVAAPVASLNIQDFLAARREARKVAPGHFRSSFVFQCSSFILASALLAVIFLVWTGVATAGRMGRQVTWDIQADPTLQQVAETLHNWRQQEQLLPGERVFAVTPDVAQYGAWFCPGDRHFFDHRYPLFPAAARDYESVCRELLPGLATSPSALANPREKGGEPVKDWRQVLRDHNVGIVVFHDREPQRLFAVLSYLAADTKEWTLLHVAGQAVIAGWNEARPPGGFAPLAFNTERLALGPQDEQTRRGLPPAPEQGPVHLPARRDLWGRLALPAAPPSWESAAATAYLRYFDDNDARRLQQQGRASLSRYAASLTGLPAQPASVLQAAFQLASSHKYLSQFNAPRSFLVREQLGPFFAHLVERSPALPLLAVRAARRAVTVNPEDSTAWLRLAQAYLLLRSFTSERSSEVLLPPLARLRYVQIVTALEQAVRLDPDLEAAHHELANLYGEHNCLDVSLEHVLEEVRLSRRAGRRPGESAADFADRMELLDKDAAKMVELVQDRRKAYAANSRRLQGERVAQATLALQLGLARQALDEILLPTPADLLGAAGIKLELDLLLRLGRVEEVRSMLGDEGFQASKHALLYYDMASPNTQDPSALYAFPYLWPAYEWLRALQSAAVGDYALARAELDAIRSGFQAGHERMTREQTALAGQLWTFLPGLFSGPALGLPAFSARALGSYLDTRALLEAGERVLRAQQANLHVLAALLDLEQGDTSAARAAFTEAQKLCTQPPGAEVPYAGGPIATRYLEQMPR